MKNQKEITGAQANASLEALTSIKIALKTGRISYDNAKHFAQPHIDNLNEYAKIISRKYKRPAGTIIFSSFMR